LSVTGGAYTFSYDGENRQRRAVQAGSPVITTDYTYDGDGRRVSRTSGSATTVFVYDAAGNLAAEYGTPPPAVSPCATGTPVTATCFWTTDHLGSVRMVSNVAGAVVSRHDYLPFGEEIPASIGRSSVANYGIDEKNPQRFTAKERDAETGLDYFGDRYYSGAQGRFTSPDKPFADQIEFDPQSWNLYSYTRNNPLRYVDPTGRCSVKTDGGPATDDPGSPCVASKDSSLTVNGNSDNSTMGSATATEYRFFPAATEFVTKFFKPVE